MVPPVLDSASAETRTGSRRRRIAAGTALAVLTASAAATLTTQTAQATSVKIPAAYAAYLKADRSADQWSLTSTHASAAWSAATGTGVTVAVIDTGVDSSGSDLTGQVLTGAHLNDKGQVVAGNVIDTDGHGTHVSGIIAAKNDGHGVTGVAPGAKILPVNVDSDKNLSGAALARAIEWAAAHGANVINLSLGLENIAYYKSDITPLCPAVAKAISEGVTVVVAAGNDGEAGNLQDIPASCPGVISVAAVDNALRPTAWSSFDTSVTVAAPGNEIMSTLPTSVDPSGYGNYSGTSMAAPFVAGVAALVLQQHPTWTPAQVKTQIETTASDVAPTGVDPRTGYGVVDPPAAVGVSAPAPTAVTYVSNDAYQWGTKVDVNGDLVLDKTLVTWTPDPSAVVTAYHLTSYTASGTHTVDLSPETIRYTEPFTTGGYVLTTDTTSGTYTSAPVWVSPTADDSTSSKPVKKVTKLKAKRAKDGSLSISWHNPKGNAVDIYEVAVFSSTASQADTYYYTIGTSPVPHSLKVKASRVPTGDLTILVDLMSIDSDSDALTVKHLNATTPFSGTALKAGATHYRVHLDLATSWARRTCHKADCAGLKVYVRAHGKDYAGWVDQENAVVVTVEAPKKRHHLTLAVVPANKKHKLLLTRSLGIKVV